MQLITLIWKKFQGSRAHNKNNAYTSRPLGSPGAGLMCRKYLKTRV